MTELRVYSRRGCHLCEQLIEELLPLVERHLSVRVCDIDDRADWRVQYGTRVPVLEYAGQTICEGHLDTAAVAALVKQIGSAPGARERMSGTHAAK